MSDGGPPPDAVPTGPGGGAGTETALPGLAREARSSGALAHVARLVAGAHESGVQVQAVAERRPDGRGASRNAPRPAGARALGVAPEPAGYAEEVRGRFRAGERGPVLVVPGLVVIPSRSSDGTLRSG